VSPLEQIADLADVPVDVEVELGHRVMTIAQILELGPESVIRIARSAGDNAVGVRITDFRQEE